MKQSILFGNGFNRLNKENLSWDGLINSISNMEFDGTVPNPIRYEASLFNNYENLNKEKDDADPKTSVNKNTKKRPETQLKSEIAGQLEKFQSNKIYKKILAMRFEHFMTTNYDNLLIKDIKKELFISDKDTEKLYSIRRRYTIKSVKKGSEDRYYWPIHGYGKNSYSIMLGYDQYCGFLAIIDSYVKGNYICEGIRLESIKKRLSSEDFGGVKSWIDLFFISDVHIIGLGLEYDEIDLWWILIKRKRIMLDTPGIVKNKIYYYQIGKNDEQKEQIFRIFDVVFVPLNEELLNDNNYATRFEAQLKKINTKLKER